MKKLLATFIFIFCLLRCEAATWYLLPPSAPTVAIFLDGESIEFSKDSVSIWTRMFIENDAAGVEFYAMKTLYSCIQRTSQVLHMSVYNAGKRLYAFESPQNAKDIIPGTVDEDTWKIFCIDKKPAKINLSVFAKIPEGISMSDYANIYFSAAKQMPSSQIK